MTANRYSGFPASFVWASGTLNLQQLGSVDLRHGAQFNETVPAGSIDRAAVVLRSATAGCRISTQDILTFMGVVSPTAGLKCTGLCTFRYQKRADSAVFAGGTTNLTAVAQTGFLMPESISASGDTPAEIASMFYPLWDGSNDPLAFTDAVNFGSAPQPAYSSEYYLGPVYLGGVQILGLESSRVTFGLTFMPKRYDGDVFPRSGAIEMRKPVITLTMTKLNWLTGQAASMFMNNLASTLAVYYALGAPAGGRAAYAGANHVKISATAGAHHADSVSVRDEGDGTISIQIVPTGTIGLSLASTIP